MRIGKLSKIDSAAVVSSETSLKGFAETNILSDETLQKWKVEQGTVTLTIEFDSITAQAVCLFNMNIEDDVTVKTFNSLTTETNSITINQSDLPGLDSINGIFELDDTLDIVKIQIIMNGVTSTFETSIGYIWAGDLIDFGTLEALAPADNGADDATITRANSTSTQPKYNYQSFKMTTNKSNTFVALQEKVRDILRTGYSTKRPFVLEDCYYSQANVFLGIFDTGAFPYDVLDPKNEYAQISKGIAEVF